MTKLKDFQDNFSKFLIGKKEIEPQFLLSKKTQNILQIHKTTFLTSLINILENNFINTKKLLGEEYFYSVSKKYIKSHLSSGLKLQNYGKNFADFLIKLKTNKYVPYISDFVQLEFLINQVLCAKDISDIKTINIQKWQSEDLLKARFSLNKKNIKILSSNYNLKDIWKFVFYSKEEDDDNANIIEKKSYHLIYKNHKEIVIKNISKKLYFLFSLKSFSFEEIIKSYNNPAKFFQDNLRYLRAL